MMGPQGAQLIDGLIVLLLPKAQPDDLASEAVIQGAGFQPHRFPPKS